MDARTRGWTAAILAGASLWGVQLLRHFTELAGPLQGRFGTLIRVSTAGATLGVAVILVLIAAAWRRLSVRQWETLAALLFAVLVVAPTIGKTGGRLALGPAHMTLDSIIQIEVASDMLVQGRNPYGEDYFGTDLDVWNRGVDRPAMHHLVYPPLPMLLTLPIRKLCLATLGVYDSRFLLLPALAGTFLLAWRSWQGRPWRAAALAAVFLNPLLVEDFHVGRWDTLILLIWSVALRAATSGKPRAMAVWLALGALTKTTLLLTAPLGAIVACRTRREALRWLALYGAVFGGVLFPFFVWGPKDLYQDLFAALQGIGPYPYAIVSSGALGFGSVVLALGWAASPAAYFPFWIVQIPATVAVAVPSIRGLLRERSLAAMGGAFAMILGTYLYFNRCSDAAWFGALISMAVLALGYDRAATPSPSGTPAESASPQAA
ncbi:MAG TPA: hypothetical protein VNM14_01090 [Planctomycetota bacterium]|nr:hypothetical protein [Planctomycetota bacterium]